LDEGQQKLRKRKIVWERQTFFRIQDRNMRNAQRKEKEKIGAEEDPEKGDGVGRGFPEEESIPFLSDAGEGVRSHCESL
jgi:hypothetical protein